MNMDEQLTKLMQEMYGKTIEQADDQELYYAVLKLSKELLKTTAPISGDKKIYYISAEFLIGKLLSNNLINLGVYDKLEEVLKAHGKELSKIEEIEPNRLLETADSEDWQPASWIRLQHLDCRVTVSV